MRFKRKYESPVSEAELRFQAHAFDDTRLPRVQSSTSYLAMPKRDRSPFPLTQSLLRGARARFIALLKGL